ncbi:L-ornithine N(5)-monooxygenase [Hypsizygus marmoreus]|uniref:L-ornithine N(5)-monooxygenase [NAD(P)H] n=1 Tax=Hypsizygus marmoreus TaxID=39966 RepID=A0A369JPY9_HYPMA|nr:L-ornithine N(5)-monooxygenase [Hypsizygus marmoreus]
MPSSQIDDTTVYDLIGLGLGPANIAIAGAIIEKKGAKDQNSFPIKNALFIEKHQVFRWHPGMLLPEARMQISFMKDLATLRNPQSPITFLSYLHSQDRLITFINRGSNIPSRKEYADYLSWAAQYVQEHGVDVLYGEEITDLTRGKNDTIIVRSRNVLTGAERVLQARDIIISPGGGPRIPESLSTLTNHSSFQHSSSYATSIGAILEPLARASRPLRIAVVGSGQSAAEVTLDLRERLSLIPIQGSRHEVDMILRKGALKPSDDSPFANEIFDPAATDVWFNLPTDRIRASKLAEYKSTNYGVVNPRTLEVLYDVIYDQKVDDAITQRTNVPKASNPRVNILPYSSIIATHINQVPGSTSNGPLLAGEEERTAESPFTLVIQNPISRVVSETNYDAIICATGYQRLSWINILKNSDIGKIFGLHSNSAAVQLLPSSRLGRLDVDFDATSTSETPSPSNGSACSTPPTSPGPLAFSGHLDKLPDTVYISRNYQLLPAQSASEEIASFKPRVYLQGVEEATHGLSDTLLSVLGVRAGEVVADLCARN